MGHFVYFVLIQTRCCLCSQYRSISFFLHIIINVFIFVDVNVSESIAVLYGDVSNFVIFTHLLFYSHISPLQSNQLNLNYALKKLIPFCMLYLQIKLQKLKQI